MLWFCLGLLARAEGIDEVDKFLYVDNHAYAPYDPDILQVCKEFKHLNLNLQIREPDSTFGNARSFVGAYHDAYQSGAPLTFMVECDVMVSKSFFTCRPL